MSNHQQPSLILQQRGQQAALLLWCLWQELHTGLQSTHLAAQHDVLHHGRGSDVSVPAMIAKSLQVSLKKAQLQSVSLNRPMHGRVFQHWTDQMHVFQHYVIYIPTATLFYMYVQPHWQFTAHTAAKSESHWNAHQDKLASFKGFTLTSDHHTGEILAMHRARTIYVERAHRSFLPLSAIVCEDINHVQIPSNKSLYGLLKHGSDLLKLKQITAKTGNGLFWAMGYSGQWIILGNGIFWQWAILGNGLFWAMDYSGQWDILGNGIFCAMDYSGQWDILRYMLLVLTPWYVTI